MTERDVNGDLDRATQAGSNKTLELQIFFLHFGPSKFDFRDQDLLELGSTCGFITVIETFLEKIKVAVFANDKLEYRDIFLLKAPIDFL